MTTEQQEKLSQILNQLMFTNQTSSFEPMSDEQWLQSQLEHEQNRRGDLDIIDGYNCDECKNTGYIPIIDNGNIVYRECKCRKVRKQLSILEKSGLKNSIMKIADFETPEQWQAEIKQKALSFITQKTARCYYIGGQSGAGKTHICSGIAREYIKQGKDTRYIMWVDMVERLKDFQQREKYANTICSVDILYIDDFFKPVGDKADYSRLDVIRTFEIIDKRYKQPKKITIISSELLLNEISAIDTATAGRIREMAKGYVIDIQRDEHKNRRGKW